jgi:hypothetical protein
MGDVGCELEDSADLQEDGGKMIAIYESKLF